MSTLSEIAANHAKTISVLKAESVTLHGRRSTVPLATALGPVDLTGQGPLHDSDSLVEKTCWTKTSFNEMNLQINL